MTLTGLHNTDLYLDENGQPVITLNGDLATISGMECWLQDIRLEAGTEAGELFYEDERGVSAYGFSMTEFLQKEIGSFGETEIRQRIKSKLEKRPDVDGRTIEQALTLLHGICTCSTRFQINTGQEEYNIDIGLTGAEVVIRGN